MKTAGLDEIDHSPAGARSAMDRRIGVRRWTAKRLLIAASALIAILLGVFLARGLGVKRIVIDRARLTVSTVERAPFQEFIPVTGAVEPHKSFFLESLEGGRVEETFVEEGSSVREGDAILRLSNSDLELELLRRADLVAAQEDEVTNTRLRMEQQDGEGERRLAELEHQIIRQRRIYERDATLHAAKLVADLDFELSRDEYQFLLRQKELEVAREASERALRRAQERQSEESLTRLRQNLAIARQKVDGLIIRAPADGLLSSRDAEVGQLKTAGQRMGQVDRQDGFKVRAMVDQHYLARTTPALIGDFDFAGATHRLRTTKVFPEVENGSFAVELEFLSAIPSELKRGQSLQIRLSLGEPSEVLTLANGAFFLKTGGHWVFVVDERARTASRRAIGLGRKNPDVYEVLSGLSPGERVITSTYDTFTDIDVIEISNGGP